MYGNTNMDVETGIRYGVIPMNEVTQVWCDSSEPVYSYDCPHCGNPLKEPGEQTCPNCKKEIDEDAFQDIEPDGYILDGWEYKAEGDSYGDIFVTKSPYYTICKLCSPCAPNAGYILDQDETGIKAYCFGHDFFEDGKAPYKIYDVKTGKEVLCENTTK